MGAVLPFSFFCSMGFFYDSIYMCQFGIILSGIGDKQMWFAFALLTFLAWGTADLFYKKASRPEDKYSHLKIVCAVGLVMGIHAIAYMIMNDLPFVPMNLIKYLPVSAMYILSMALGYMGLRYIELSISSPIQNSSGAVSAVLLLIFFGFDQLSALEYAGVAMLCLGVFWLSCIEKKNADAERLALGSQVEERYRKGFMAILFPIFYCIIDGLGSFADGIYLDQLELMSEDAALVAYELTFLICAVVAFIFIRIKKDNFNIFREKSALAAAVFETVGQYFYVFAMAQRSVAAAPIVASYCVLSVVWSRIFLKEKLSGKQYAAIAVVFGGILLCGIAEGLAG